MKFPVGLLLLFALLPAACQKNEASHTSGIGTNLESQPLVIVKRYKANPQFTQAIQYISGMKANIYLADVEKLDGNVETVIYAATADEAMSLQTRDVVSYNFSFSSSRDNFALCMFKETDNCDINWQDEAFVVINKKEGTQKILKPIVNHKRTRLTLIRDDSHTLTISFDEKVTPMNQADLDEEEYGAGAELYKQDAFLEFNSYSKGKDFSTTVTVKELCEKGQVSIWRNGENLLGTSDFPNELVTKDCSQDGKIVLKLAEDKQVFMLENFIVSGYLAK
jgi:hypothetical protein